jgi:hypothetical protein
MFKYGGSVVWECDPTQPTTGQPSELIIDLITKFIFINPASAIRPDVEEQLVFRALFGAFVA